MNFQNQKDHISEHLNNRYRLAGTTSVCGFSTEQNFICDRKVFCFSVVIK